MVFKPQCILCKVEQCRIKVTKVSTWRGTLHKPESDREIDSVLTELWGLTSIFLLTQPSNVVAVTVIQHQPKRAHRQELKLLILFIMKLLLNREAQIIKNWSDSQIDG